MKLYMNLRFPRQMIMTHYYDNEIDFSAVFVLTS